MSTVLQATTQNSVYLSPTDSLTASQRTEQANKDSSPLNSYASYLRGSSSRLNDTDFPIAPQATEPVTATHDHSSVQLPVLTVFQTTTRDSVCLPPLTISQRTESNQFKILFLSALIHLISEEYTHGNVSEPKPLNIGVTSHDVNSSS